MVSRDLNRFSEMGRRADSQMFQAIFLGTRPFLETEQNIGKFMNLLKTSDHQLSQNILQKLSDKYSHTFTERKKV